VKGTTRFSTSGGRVQESRGDLRAKLELRQSRAHLKGAEIRSGAKRNERLQESAGWGFKTEVPGGVWEGVGGTGRLRTVRQWGSHMAKKIVGEPW